MRNFEGIKEEGIKEPACTLTTFELRERKMTVLKNLRNQAIERKELDKGFAYKFPGSDKVLDDLIEFIKTERECCSFFVFGLTIKGDKSEIWLELTGAKDVKPFIEGELEL